MAFHVLEAGLFELQIQGKVNYGLIFVIRDEHL